jgi:hypothetical protein
MGILEREITDDMIEEKIKELKPKHSQLATILEGIRSLSLEDTVRVLILSEGLEWILKARAMRLVNTREKAITDEMVEERIKELKPHHPIFAAILERVHEMNLKEAVNALVVLEGLRWLLKIHAARLATS